jgi:hypothetical protein
VEDKKTKIAITEEMGVHEGWYKEAKDITEETLPEFIRHLSHDYHHDYGTICHAISAGALAAAWAVEHSPYGGITGFQAGAVMWGFVAEWLHYKDEPMKFIKYREMLFPQYKQEFTCISKETWDWLQKEAKSLLETNGSNGVGLHPNVRAHLERVVSGEVPFGYRVTK